MILQMFFIPRKYGWLDVLTCVVDVIFDHVGFYFMIAAWSLCYHIGFYAFVYGLVHLHLGLFLFFHGWYVGE